MARTCARAVAQGLAAVAFTEHVDFTPFRAGFLAREYAEFVVGGSLIAPEFDLDGYLECVERCRSAYPELVILTGVEVGQPHRHAAELADLFSRASLDRVLGSLHCLLDGEEFAEPWELFARYPAADVFRAYLEEIPRVVAGSQAFDAFAHIDYPVRSWPADEKPFDPRDFEDELREALRALAQGDRDLEINTRLPLDPLIVQWWREEGGRRVTFGSDAHQPDLVGAGFARASEVARAFGFESGRYPGSAWIRTC